MVFENHLPNCFFDKCLIVMEVIFRKCKLFDLINKDTIFREIEVDVGPLAITVLQLLL